VVEEAVDHYHSEVEKLIQYSMDILEEEVRSIQDSTQDRDVDRHVRKDIPNLGCTRNTDSKFHMTMELY
jgi:hypothetical protein